MLQEYRRCIRDPYYHVGAWLSSVTQVLGSAQPVTGIQNPEPRNSTKKTEKFLAEAPKLLLKKLKNTEKAPENTFFEYFRALFIVFFEFF